jgi:uncharacterized membrane protein YtjA (UPF0391 family)
VLGYTAGVTLILFCLLAVISLVRIFQGKLAGIWGKATGIALVLFTCAFVLWTTIEIPAFERQQTKINYQKGQEYMDAQDLEKAYNSFKQISKVDITTYDKVQPIIKDIQGKMALAKLEEAKALYTKLQYTEALKELQTSLQYTELEEAKALLPAYKSAAGGK